MRSPPLLSGYCPGLRRKFIEQREPARLENVRATCAGAVARQLWRARCGVPSTTNQTARQRLAGLKSITPLPDFGTTLKLSEYEADIDALGIKLDAYNEMLSRSDQLQNELESLEGGVREKNVRILSAAEARYGPDSSEYEQAGGTRRSERKRAGPKGSKKGSPAPAP